MVPLERARLWITLLRTFLELLSETFAFCGWEHRRIATWWWNFKVTHLSLGEVEVGRQVLALLSHHVVVILEGVFQAQQLRRAKRGPDSLRLPEWQQETRLGPWKYQKRGNEFRIWGACHF